MTQTTIPKTSSAGMKCHVGPGCRLHSPTGIAGARKALRLATDAVQNSSTLQEMSEAKAKMVSAQAHYDMTQEGQDSLAQSIKDETDSIQKRLLVERLKTASAKAEEAEAEFSATFEPVADDNNGLINKITFPETSTYTEPVFTTGSDSMYAATVGDKYRGYRPTTDIAKDVRKDILEAKEKGYLPANLEYNVTRDPSSVKVVIRGLTDEAAVEKLGNRREQNTAEAKELMGRVSKIVNAYNSRCNMPQIDYFQNTFHAQTTIEDNWQRDWREKEKTRTHDMREINKQKNTYKSAIETSGVEAFISDKNIAFTGDANGTKFGRIGDTNFFAFKRTSAVNGREIFEVYNLNGVTAPAGKTVEGLLSEGGTALQNLAWKSKKTLVIRKS